MKGLIMKKLWFLFLSLIITLPIFGVDYKLIGKHNSLYGIAISPKDRTENNLKLLALQLEKDYAKETSVLIRVYDNEEAAEYTAENIYILPTEKRNLHDNHFVAEYWRAPGKYHKFTIMLNGVNGEKETIDFKTTDIKEFERQVLGQENNKIDETSEKSETQNTTAESETTEIASETNNQTQSHNPALEVIPLVFIGLCVYLIVKRKEEKNWIAVGIFCGLIILLFALPQSINGIKTILLIVLIVSAIFISKRSKQTKAVREIQNGNLPIVKSRSIILQKGETCHFQCNADYVEVKNVVVGRQGRSAGISTRLMKGVWLHSGRSQSVSVRGNIAVKTSGIFTVTSQRVVFSGVKGAFNKRLSEITSLTPYDDGIGIQFNEKHYVLQFKNAFVAQNIIEYLIESK